MMIKIGRYIIDTTQIKYCFNYKNKDCVRVVFKNGTDLDCDYITFDDLYEAIQLRRLS